MSNSSKVERKLAAIMFTDIVGYTEQMSKNQDVAFVLLEEKQSKLKPLIKEHNGTLVKEMGDGTLSHYPTAVDASNCSVELQKLIKDNDKLNVINSETFVNYLWYSPKHWTEWKERGRKDLTKQQKYDIGIDNEKIQSKILRARSHRRMRNTIQSRTNR